MITLVEEFDRSVIEEQGVRIVHIFDKEYPFGGVTIAYVPQLIDPKSKRPRGLFARVAVAYCNPKDRYSRKAGEQRAFKNLNAGECVLMPIYGNGHPVREIKHIFQYVFGY